MKKSMLVVFAGLMTVNSFAGVLVKETFEKGTLETPGAVSPALELVKTDDGQAMKIADWPSKIVFPAKSSINLDEGTLEFKLKFSIEPAKIMDKSWTMFRAYSGSAFKNGFFIVFGWKSGLMFIVCDKNGQRFALNYPQIRDWKADEWHQVAFTWKIKNPGESQISLNIDYKPVATQSGLTIEFDKDAWQKRIAFEGTEQASQKPDFLNGGVIFGNWGEKMTPDYWSADDITIYDTAVTFSEKSL